jgi:DDE domain
LSLGDHGREKAAFPKALKELKAEGTIAEACELRQVKYLNNLVEQDHRFIKRLVKPGLGFFALETAWRRLQGYEAMHMIRKGEQWETSPGRLRSSLACLEQPPKLGNKRSFLSLGFLHEFLQQNPESLLYLHPVHKIMVCSHCRAHTP